jgi:hypothetical protein
MGFAGNPGRGNGSALAFPRPLTRFSRNCERTVNDGAGTTGGMRRPPVGANHRLMQKDHVQWLS